jgi:hypothetical protein
MSIVAGGLDIVDRAGADHGQQPWILTGEHLLHGLPPGHDRGRRRLVEWEQRL